MSGYRVIGIIAAIVGAVLLYFGINGSHSLVDQASQTLTGRFTQQTMVYIILGIVALVGGALTALVGRR
jgi:drug/metabolite transporter (DMT)-like permease